MDSLSQYIKAIDRARQRQDPDAKVIFRVMIVNKHLHFTIGGKYFQIKIRS